MSTSTPDRAAQLLFLFLIVILTVKATPVLSSLISDRTYELGDFVGNGPSVSVGETVQEPEEPPELESVSSVESVSFLQALANGAIAARPRAANPFFRKCFLSIMIIFLCS